MQTFLPYADFARSAAVLDGPRLGKQRVEVLQVLRALELPDYGWANHPAVRMWRGFTPALVLYGLTCVAQWTSTGRADSTGAQIAEFAPEVTGPGAEVAMPPWFGDEEFHHSHRSALLRKDPEFYRSRFADDAPSDGEPDEPDDEPGEVPYVWPEPPATETPARPAGRPVWVVRPAAAQALGEFLVDGVVGLGTGSGIDVDVRGAAEGSTLRALLKEIDPDRRPGKELRVLEAFVHDLVPGAEVGVPIEGERALLLGEVLGDYEFEAGKGRQVRHRRRVRWGGRAERTDVRPPALLQDPRSLFRVNLTT